MTNKKEMVIQKRVRICERKLMNKIDKARVHAGDLEFRPDTIEGWKQIAECLGVSIASVKRWKPLLPIKQSVKHCRITANRKDLLKWLAERNSGRPVG